MAYAIKDTVSGKYMSKSKTLESSTSNALTYGTRASAEAAVARLQKLYDNWKANDDVVTARGYTNAYKAITPSPVWATQSIR
jgi:hypothetical protein